MQELQIAIPKELANMQLPDPDLRDFYRDEDDRVFVVNDEIDDSLLALVRMIIRCNKEDKDFPIEDRRPIKVLIASPGGDIVPLWTTIKAIEISKTPVWTINMCYCYSAAAELLASGKKRFALPGTQVMIHRGSTYIGGEQSVVESTQKHFNGLEKKLTDYLLEHTKIDVKVYKKKASSDMYYDENGALDNGIIDQIVNDFNAIF